ncbi:MAG: 1-acyl-sn-glycerol-3-phosphate acyltransferase [Rhodobacteraceae bacterium]|nr:1-acyl-sn-glycerol-3-phosphate acyltransferase [Paracoccaceae bacterium]
MSYTWRSGDVPAPAPIGAAGWVRAGLKGGGLVVLTFGCLGILLALRLVERPLFGLRRPWTPWITRFVCRNAFRILGMRYRVAGRAMAGRGAVVANHASWLDIYTMNASQLIYYVAKTEIGRWPGIGWLARATGSMFIDRDPRQARDQAIEMEARLRIGQRLLFFPEGTSSDGRRVLPFRSTLFAAFYADGLAGLLEVQPVSVTYHAPPGRDPRFYGWWGDMDFGAHLLQVLAAPRQGAVDVVFHPPLRVADYPDRKALAAACEAVVRAGLSLPEAARQGA